LANFSPWLERSDNLGIAKHKLSINPERVKDVRGLTLSGFERLVVDLFPVLSLRSYHGLKLANAFGV
jgi:hypothetical protein